MTKKQIVFSDRLVGVSIYNGLVRMDLAVSAGSPAQEGSDKPTFALEVTHQLILPVEAFLAAAAMQQQVVQEIVAREQKRREAVAAPEAAATTN